MAAEPTGTSRREGEFHDAANLILDECRIAINLVDPASVERLLDAIQDSDKVFFIGVGRVFLALQALAKRLTHLGVRTYLVGQITEPAIGPRDLLIVGSGSGESIVPVAIARKAKALGARVAHIGSNAESSLQPITDIFVRIPTCTKLERADEIRSRQPMTTLFDQSLLVFGDALCGMIIRRRKLDMQSLWQQHANLE